MALGVGLLFPPAADGRPCAMYVADLRAACTACGYPCTRRYFLSARFHSLTLARLEQILDDVPCAIEGECEQCDQKLRDEAVERWSLLISPGDGLGLLHGLSDRSGSRQWRVFPHEHLDVQGLPKFEFDEDRSAIALEPLDERGFFGAVDRYWSPKSALRRLLVAAADDVWIDLPGARREPDGAFRISPAPGLELWIGPFEAGEAEEDAIDQDANALVVLVEDGELADGWPDAPARWLADLAPLLEGRDVIASASMDAAEEALRTHLDRFPVDVSYLRQGNTFTVTAGDGSTPTSRLVFALDEIATEAARTCASPGDMARIELDRALVMLDLARPRLDPLVEDGPVVR